MENPDHLRRMRYNKKRGPVFVSGNWTCGDCVYLQTVHDNIIDTDMFYCTYPQALGTSGHGTTIKYIGPLNKSPSWCLVLRMSGYINSKTNY
jgi:hypothetical protein